MWIKNAYVPPLNDWVIVVFHMGHLPDHTQDDKKSKVYKILDAM